ncbi:MAG: nucleoside deaminase [Bacteroidia bacterium]|nr:nucleoside deaminase [Bacteroidia bacterium]
MPLLPSDHQKFMSIAISIAQAGMRSGAGGPFGAIVVKDGEIIGRGHNIVLAQNDPTSHAEIIAIRDACSHLGHFQLTGCTIYTSCEPCPMCLGAIYWARPDRFFYACTRSDAANIGFDDQFIYQEFNLDPISRSIPATQIGQEQSLKVFEEWKTIDDKTLY